MAHVVHFLDACLFADVGQHCREVELQTQGMLGLCITDKVTKSTQRKQKNRDRGLKMINKVHPDKESRGPEI